MLREEWTHCPLRQLQFTSFYERSKTRFVWVSWRASEGGSNTRARLLSLSRDSIVWRMERRELTEYDEWHRICNWSDSKVEQKQEAHSRDYGHSSWDYTSDCKPWTGSDNERVTVELEDWSISVTRKSNAPSPWRHTTESNRVDRNSAETRSEHSGERSLKKGEEEKVLTWSTVPCLEKIH